MKLIIIQLKNRISKDKNGALKFSKDKNFIKKFNELFEKIFATTIIMVKLEILKSRCRPKYQRLNEGKIQSYRGRYLESLENSRL